VDLPPENLSTTDVILSRTRSCGGMLVVRERMAFVACTVTISEANSDLKIARRLIRTGSVTT
jgi:hypothetical protein